MKKSMLAVVLSLVLVFSVVGMVSAIKYGEPDGDGHPYVGLMVAQDGEGNPLWRCTGTLLSPTLYLTAGHCTYGAEHVEIWFDADVQSGVPQNGYPYNGEVGGTPYTHPNYDDNAFYLYDLGVVVLDEPVYMDEYGTLPELGQLDVLATKRGKQDVTFTTVGYGLQFSNPVHVEALKIRMVAYPHIVKINNAYVGSFSVQLSNNASTGGSCFGDSGGPNFLNDTNIVAGVTSYGNNNCTGLGGVYRLDQADDLSWLYSEFGQYLP